MDLVEFVRARLDEDEATAKRMLDGAEYCVWPWEVWVTPGVRKPSEPAWEVEPSIGVAEHAPKAYRRIWAQDESKYPHTDDGWHLHQSAICVWSEEVAKRQLREVAAKRAIVGRCVPGPQTEAALERGDISTEEYVTEEAVGFGILCQLAAVWSDHPDYREEWACPA